MSEAPKELMEQIAEALCLIKHGNDRWVSDYYKEAKAIASIIDSQVKAGREKQGTYITCPFCGKNGFDLTGLKCHLNNNCEQYQMTEEWVTYFQH